MQERFVVKSSNSYFLFKIKEGIRGRRGVESTEQSLTYKSWRACSYPDRQLRDFVIVASYQGT